MAFHQLKVSVSAPVPGCILSPPESVPFSRLDIPLKCLGTGKTGKALPEADNA